MPHGVVLAGGRSSRMGSDKALVEVDGVAMARRVADALAAGGCDPVWCQGGDAPALALVGLAVRADDVAHRGPLAAVAAALRAAAPQDAVVAACDLPDLDGPTIAGLIAVGGRGHAPVVAAADSAGVHLVAWWSAAALAPLEALLAGGIVSYRAAVEQLGGVRMDVASGAVRNVNRPDDLLPPGAAAGAGGGTGG